MSAAHVHADAHIFRSLPRTQALRAARLLAEIGDARGRFPTPEALASLAGVSPSTRQSGKSRVVGFRWAVDRQLRDALVEWAGDSRLSSRWAAEIYQRARARGHDHPHAVRVLGTQFLAIMRLSEAGLLAISTTCLSLPSRCRYSRSRGSRMRRSLLGRLPKTY